MTVPIKVITLIGAGSLSACLATVSFAGETTGEHKFQLKTRAIYFDRDYAKDSNDRDQSALAFQLNYNSPQFNDFIGVGLSGYMVNKLGAGGRQSEDILTSDSDGLDGFSLIGQAYLNITPTDNSSIKLGRQLHKSMFLASSGSRAVPNTFQGISAQYSPMKGMTIFAAAYDEWSRRARDSWEGFATDQSGDIDYVGLVGIKYKTKTYSVEAEHLVSDDYLAKLGVRGSYSIPLESSKLKISGGVFASYDDGALFVTGAEGGDLDDEDVAGSTVGVTPSDNDGLGAYVDFALKKGNAEYSIAYTKIDGIWIEDNFSGDHGRNPFPTRSRVGPDLTNENESVVRLKFKYDWKDYVPGLVSTLAIAHGWDAENSADSSLGKADEDWQEIHLSYKPKAVKGLKLSGALHNYEADETGSVDGVKGDETDLRLYVDYTINF